MYQQQTNTPNQKLRPLYDVAVIGAGVIGSCVARELSRYALDVIVLEKESDVATGTTKANSGIVHGGYAATPHTNKAKYNVLGQQMFDTLSKELDISFRRNGSMVVCFAPEELPRLEALKEQGLQNGLTDLYIASGEKLHELEPHLSSQVVAALVVPCGGIVCPYSMCIALAENAATNGVTFLLDTKVTHIVKQDAHFLITTPQETISARTIVNAAGLYADEINNMLSADKQTLTPRRGEYFLLDKTQGTLISHTIFQLPTDMGKGVLVTPTVDGTLLIGPTSEDITQKDDTATTKEGLAEVLVQAGRSVDVLPKRKIITSFCGLRAHSKTDDFLIEEAADVPGLFNLCGIESPGLTAAPAIGKEVANMVADRLQPAPNKQFNPIRKGIRRFAAMTLEEKKQAIAENPDYGQIICRCESVSKAEILAALRSPLAVNNLDAVKRRTRAGMGRCQGGFCCMHLPKIIAKECHMTVSDVTKSGEGSQILTSALF